jgi:hypothetical protein
MSVARFAHLRSAVHEIHRAPLGRTGLIVVGYRKHNTYTMLPPF